MGVASIVASLALAAGPASPAPSVPVVARLEGGWEQENFGRLLATLDEEGLLPTRVTANTHLKTVGAVFADAIGATVDQLPGGTIDPNLDRLLCKLNPHVCKRKDGKSLWSLQTGPETKLDYRVTRTCKDALAPHELCVPDLKLGAYDTALRYKYTPGKDDLGQIVTNRSRGCAALDDACRKLIEALNPHRGAFDAIENTPAKDSVLLPATGYRVEFKAPDAGVAEKAVGTIRSIERKPAINQANVLADTVVDAKRDFQPFALHGVGDEPVQGNVQALRAMGFPVDDSAALFSNLLPVDVAVWDTRIDADHCDFAEADGTHSWIFLDPDPDASEGQLPARRPGCSGDLDTAMDVDHATQVAGLISARLNGSGIVGVNPHVRLWNYEISAARLANDRDDAVMRRLRQSFNPRVVNMSVGRTDNDLDALKKYVIGGYVNMLLYVAAAGNDSRTIDPGNASQPCNIWPACWSETGRTDGDGKPIGRNVISVVALTADGKNVLDDSNRGQAFEVGAVGVATSTSFGNRYSTFQGTSAAAPFVAGLASLLYAKAASDALLVAPAMVKQRIVATVDFDPVLQAQMKFGRINFERALRYQSDLIAGYGCAAPACAEAVTVDHRYNAPLRLTRAFRKSGGPWTHGCVGESSAICMPTNMLRRLWRTGEVGGEPVYGAIVLEDGAPVYLIDVTFAAGAALQVLDAGNRRQSRPIAEIADYTACSFRPACEPE